ncbi:helix-turn-helix domain-containing protein [Ralstonia solanacearum]|nr:helix-turn-helix domain-containing protein [Ralstonia solanacearum]QKM24810.1 helix-turn-helix domain-containing protein [Ralstonia solanacearum]QKM29619.1 helix-turn-helix domain-containing protein [Ralstonia solanacearum]
MPRLSKQTVPPSAEDRLQKLDADVGKLGKELSRIQKALGTLVSALLETDADNTQKPNAHSINDEIWAQELAAFLDSNKETVSRHLLTQLRELPPHSVTVRRTKKGEVLLNDGLAAIAGARDCITTREAAAVLNLTQQTLRRWACFENGPIRPARINGRLGWRVTDLAALLNGEKP